MNKRKASFQSESAAVIWVAASSRNEADRIGRTLVEEKIAACANIVPGVHSFFIWNGRLCEEEECLLILKTRESRVIQLIEKIKSLHSYELPEIVVLPVSGGSKEYIDWIMNSTTGMD